MASGSHLYDFAGYPIATSMALPELRAHRGQSAPRFRIEEHHLPSCAERPALAWRHDFVGPDNSTTLTCARLDGGHLLEFPGVATLEVAPGGRILLSAWPEASPETVRHVLLDQALPRLLAQGGELVLHGAVVRLPSGKTILLLGDSGAGKSTLAGACWRAGGELLNDDGAVIRLATPRVLAQPTYPGLRLLPDSLETLFAGHSRDSQAMADYSAKRRVEITLADGPSAVELDAMVLLEAPTADTALGLTRLAASAACLMAMRHGFQLDMSDQENLMALLRQAGDLTARVPIHVFRYPRSYDRLPDVVAYLDASL